MKLFWTGWFLALLIGEMYSMTDRRALTATQFIVKYVPAWLALPVFVWLFFHFAFRYFSSSYIKWLLSK